MEASAILRGRAVSHKRLPDTESSRGARPCLPGLLPVLTNAARRHLDTNQRGAPSRQRSHSRASLTTAGVSWMGALCLPARLLPRTTFPEADFDFTTTHTLYGGVGGSRVEDSTTKAAL